MKRKVSDILYTRKKDISTKTILSSLYENVNDIPEEIITSFPLLDYISIDHKKIQDKLSLMMDDYTRKKEKKEREEVREIIAKFLKDEHFTIKKFIFTEKGGIEEDNHSHRHYSNRNDVGEEFNTHYLAKILLTINVKGEDYDENDFFLNCDDEDNYSLNFYADIFQDMDIGNEEVTFTTHTIVDFSEDIGYNDGESNIDFYVSKADDDYVARGLMEEDEVKELLYEIIEKFIVNKFILKKINDEKFTHNKLIN